MSGRNVWKPSGAPPRPPVRATVAEPLDEDWSPTGLLEVAAQVASNSSFRAVRVRRGEPLTKALAVSRSIDEFRAAQRGHPGEHEDCTHVDAVAQALEGERTMSGAARRRVLAALGIEQ